MTATGARPPRSTCAARRSPTSARSTSGPPIATCGPTRRRSATASSRRWPDSTTPRGTSPARPPRTPAGRTGRWPSTSATSPTGRSSPSTTSAWRSRPARGRATTTTTAATSIATTSAAARRGRRCRPRPSRRGWADARPRLLAAPQPAAATTRSGRRGVGLGVHGPPRPLPRPPRGHRAVGRSSCAPARSTATRSSTTRAPPTTPGFRGQDAAIEAQFDALIRDSRSTAGTAERSRPAGRCATTSATSPTGPTEAVRAIDVSTRGHWLADPDEGVDAWNERHVEAPRGRDAGRRRSARYDAARAALLAAIDTPVASTSCARRTAGLGLRLPPRAHPQAPGHARSVVRRRRWPSAERTERTPGAATGAGLTIESIVAVDSPREFRVNPRDRVVAYTAEIGGARQLFTLSLRGTGTPPTQLTASEKPCQRSAVVARRPAAGLRPRRRDLDHRGRRVARDARGRQARRRSRAALVARRASPGVPVPTARLEPGLAHRRAGPSPRPTAARPAGRPIATALTAAGIDVDAIRLVAGRDALAIAAQLAPGRPRHPQIALVDVASGASRSSPARPATTPGRAGLPTARSSTCPTRAAGSRSCGVRRTVATASS